MPHIFDNLERQLLPALRQTLEVADRADFCVGYFNLRGWKELDRYVERWSGGEGYCCRLLVGMHRPPQDELRAAMSLAGREEGMDNSTALRLRRKLAEEFREQLALGIPSDEDEARLRLLAAQIRAKKVQVLGEGLPGMPYFVRNGARIAPPHGRTMTLESGEASSFAACLINSSLFYWYYSLFSDGEHINDALIRGFPIPCSWGSTDWAHLGERLATSLTGNAKRKTIRAKEGHTIEYDEIKALQSKPVIDEIDRVLARHYGFTEEELDFIINYDIKYRMGRDAENGE